MRPVTNADYVVFGMGQSWTVLALSGSVLIPSSETTSFKKKKT
jgi:hypothetical protein